MENALAKLDEFPSEKVELLKRTICNDATDDELELFVHACKRTGLDPFMKQIYAVKRFDEKAKRSVMTIQTGIDGYRLIADRTNKYAGNDDPEFAGETLEETFGGWKHPIKSRVTVWKMVEGQKCSFTATARWDGYYPGDKMGFMWRKMPHVMLAKVAEALALRKAFPAELSGVYTGAEMDQALNDSGPQEQQQQLPPPVQQPLPIKRPAGVQPDPKLADDRVFLQRLTSTLAARPVPFSAPEAKALMGYLLTKKGATLDALDISKRQSLLAIANDGAYDADKFRGLDAGQGESPAGETQVEPTGCNGVHAVKNGVCENCCEKFADDPQPFVKIVQREPDSVADLSNPETFTALFVEAADAQGWDEQTINACLKKALPPGKKTVKDATTAWRIQTLALVRAGLLDPMTGKKRQEAEVA